MNRMSRLGRDDFSIRAICQKVKNNCSVSFGNVNETSIRELWKRKNEAFVRLHLEHRWDELPEMCKHCRDWKIIGEMRYDEYGRSMESTMQEESRELFLRKLTAWQEEHEYRLLLPADEVKEAYDCKLHYDFHALQRIYIGRNVSINDILGLREALEAVCKEQHHTVDVYQILGFQGTVSFATQAIQQKLFTVQARE